MTIIQHDDNKKGDFEAIKDNVHAGLMTYVWAGENKLIIDHTEVEPAFAGQKVGNEMVMKAVEFAREKHIKIIPLCPFAKSVFDRTESIHDVLF